MRRILISWLALSAIAHADAVVPNDPVAEAVPVAVEGPFKLLPAKNCTKELPNGLPVWGEFAIVEHLCQELPDGNLRHVMAMDTTGVWYVVPLGASGKVLHEGLPMEVQFTLVGMRYLSRDRVEAHYHQDLFGVQDRLLQCSVTHGERPICRTLPFRPPAPR